MMKDVSATLNTKTEQALRRYTKKLRDFSRTVSLHKRLVCLSIMSLPRGCRLTRSHGVTEFLHETKSEGLSDNSTQSFSKYHPYRDGLRGSFLSVPPSLRVRHFLSRREAYVSTKRRGRGECLFVNRRTGEPFSCRTAGARSCRHHRENPKGEDSRVATGDATGIRPDDVRVASIAQCAISRRWRFVVARSAETTRLAQ